MIKSKTTPEILPAHLADVDVVAEAAAGLAEAMDRLEDARAQDREARANLKGAADFDRQALHDAVAAGKPTPQPTEAERKAEAETARRRLGAANTLGTERGDALRAAIIEHRAKLDAIQAPRVEAAATEVVEAIDALATKLDVLAQEAGTRRALFAGRREKSQADDRSRMLGRVPAAAIPSFEPVRHTAAKHVAELRASVEGMIVTPIAPRDRRAERKREQEQKAAGKQAEREEQEQRQANRRERASRGDEAA